MTLSFKAVVHCDRCHRERQLSPTEGCSLRDSAFAVACWLHDTWACGHAPFHDARTHLFMRQDAHHCILCRSRIPLDWMIRNDCTETPFLLRARISVHYHLCKACSIRTGGHLCAYSLGDPLVCCRVSEKRWLLQGLLPDDCLWLIAGIVVSLLRQGTCCLST